MDEVQQIKDIMDSTYKKYFDDKLNKRYNDIINNGRYWTFQQSIAIPASGYKYLLGINIDVSKTIVVTPIQFFSTKGCVEVKFYINHNYVPNGDDDRLDIYNRDTNIIVGRKFRLYDNPQGTDLGFNIATLHVGVESTPVYGGGGGNAEQSPDVFKQNNNKPYLVRFDNISNVACFLDIVLTWEEFYE